MQSHITNKVSILVRLGLSLILVLFLFAPGVEAYAIEKSAAVGVSDTFNVSNNRLGASSNRGADSTRNPSSQFPVQVSNDLSPNGGNINGEQGEIHYIQYFSNGEIPEDCPSDIIEPSPTGNSDIQSRSLISFVTKKLNYYLGKSSLWSSGKKMFVQCFSTMIIATGVPVATAVYEAEMLFARYEPVVMEYCLGVDDATYIIADTLMVANQRGITLDKFEPLLLENATKAASTGTTLSGAAGGYMEQAFIMCAQNGMIPASFMNSDLWGWLVNELLGSDYQVMPDSPFAPSASIPLRSNGILDVGGLSLPLKMVDGPITGVTKAYGIDDYLNDLPAPIDINPSYQWIYKDYLFCTVLNNIPASGIEYRVSQFSDSTFYFSFANCNEGDRSNYIYSVKDNCWMSPYCTRAKLNGLSDVFFNCSYSDCFPPNLFFFSKPIPLDIYINANYSYQITTEDGKLYAEYNPATGWHSVTDGVYQSVNNPDVGHNDTQLEWTGNDAVTAPDGTVTDAGNINVNIPHPAPTWPEFVEQLEGNPIPKPPEPPAPDPTPKPDPPTPTPDPTPKPDPPNPPSSDFEIGDLTKVFPFCIPFDLYFLLATFAAHPITPCFNWHFSFPGIGEYDFNVDLSPFNPVASTLRLVEKIAFCVGLVLVTRDLIRG